MKTLVFLCTLILLFSCDKKRVYDAYFDLNDKKWEEGKVLNYTFRIPDASKDYHIIYNIRYSLSYPFCNLYLKYYLLDSTGHKISSDLHELQLMDCKSGEPLGTGGADIQDLPVYALKNFRFPYPGKYKMCLQQYMRQNPLPEILAVGIRVETTEP